MGNLVLTLIGIAVFVASVLAGSNFISYEGIESNTQSNRISSSIIKVSGSISEYWTFQSDYPENINQLIPDILSSLPSISAYNLSGSLLSPIEFDGEHLINEEPGVVELCMGSNAISSLEAMSLAKSVELLGEEKVSFHTSCSTTDKIALDLSEIASGNYTSVNVLIKEGDSVWMKYYLIGSVN